MMERLTFRNEHATAFWVDVNCPGGGYRMTEDKQDQKRLDRLAAYEDTGLEPEEILSPVEMASMACALQKLKQYEAIGTVEELTTLNQPKPNPPLTVDELRGMDGEPVWIERCCSESPDDREWALVDSLNDLCKVLSGFAPFRLYGKTWLAYRRKPEEVE